jgi:ribosomal protein S18 acetylase RimI-like enzyme
MRQRFHIQTTEDLSAFAAFCGTPGFSADTVAAHRADGHLVALDPDGVITARCSLWWRSAPPVPGHRPGIIGHYAAGSATAGSALLKVAGRDLAARGCTVAVGPMDGNTWRSYRLITCTSPRPAFFLEPGFPPGRAGHFELAGFKPQARYFSAMTGRLDDPPLSASDPRGRFTGLGIILRPLELERFEEELSRIYPLCLASFKDHLLFTPIPEEEFVSMHRPLRPCLIPGLSWVAQVKTTMVGFVFALPDILQARRGETVDTVVLKTLAVAPAFRGVGLGHELVVACQSAAAARGFLHVFHALIREGNPSGRISAHFARPIRSYALFAKELVRA